MPGRCWAGRTAPGPSRGERTAKPQACIQRARHRGVTSHWEPPVKMSPLSYLLFFRFRKLYAYTNICFQRLLLLPTRCPSSDHHGKVWGEGDQLQWTQALESNSNSFPGAHSRQASGLPPTVMQPELHELTCYQDGARRVRHTVGPQ